MRFGVSLVYRGWGVPFWFVPKDWWADHFWFEIESQFFGSRLVFGLFMVSFGRSEVERWWKLNDLSDRSFSVVARLWCSGLEFNFEGFFIWGWVVTRRGIGYRVYSGRLREVVYFRWWCVLWWVLSLGVFLGWLFSGVPPIYDAFCLYSQLHRSLFILSRDLVV